MWPMQIILQTQVPKCTITKLAKKMHSEEALCNCYSVYTTVSIVPPGYPLKESKV